MKYFANADQFPKDDSVSFAALEALKALKKKLDKEFIEKCLDDDTKCVSFNLVSEKNLTSVKLVVETYELVKCHHLFLGNIKSLVYRRKFKEAGQLAAELELCDAFTIEDILIPLFLEDKQSIFEDYFAKAGQPLRLQMMSFLDSLLEPPHDTALKKCLPFIDKFFLRDINNEKFTIKSIHKLIRRLSKLHNIDKSKTPNDQKYNEEKELSFMIKYHYEAKKSSHETFIDNVKDYIKPKKLDLQLQLIQQCLDFEQVDDAQMFIKHFEIPEQLLPEMLQRSIDQALEPKKPRIAEKKRPSNVDDGWGDEDDEPIVEDFYELNLNESQIFIVDTAESFSLMLDRLKVGPIAFDTEFTMKNTAAILQLAIPDAVFIVDVFVLENSKMKSSMWSQLADEVFNNDEIIKVAFGYSADLEVLRKIRGLRINNSTAAYRDLKTLSEKAFEKPDFRFPFHVKSFGESLSLSKLVKMCFGKELNKGDRMSNWCRRPLRPYQVKYAALDAFVLLEICEILPEIL